MIAFALAFFLVSTGATLALLSAQRPAERRPAPGPAASPLVLRTLPAAPVAVRLSAPRYCPDIVTTCARIRDAYDELDAAMSRRLACIPYTREAYVA